MTLRARAFPRQRTGADESSQTAGYLDTLLDCAGSPRRLPRKNSSAPPPTTRSRSSISSAPKGCLLTYTEVTVVRGKDEAGLPQLRLEKGGRDGRSTQDGK